MQSDDDLEGSVAVEIVAWTLYLGWLSTLAWGALYLGIEPLHSVQRSFDVRWQGTVAALALGVGFLLVANKLYGVMKARMAASAAEN